MAAKTGHLGPTVFRRGPRPHVEGGHPPPAFPGRGGEKPRAVERVFWLTPGHSCEPGVWYAGTAPAGLFRSADGGDHWEPVAGFNDHAMNAKWAAGSRTPDGEFLHSVLVDPRNARHLYLAISIGGVFESTDGGQDWAPLNGGVAADFLPDPTVAFGHDPHCVIRIRCTRTACISRTTAASTAWIGRRDAGFASGRPCRRASATSASRSCCTRGTPTWPGCCRWTARPSGRASVGGKPAVYHTRDAGRSWRRLDRGLPGGHAWFTVLRQAMCVDAHAPGSTSAPRRARCG